MLPAWAPIFGVGSCFVVVVGVRGIKGEVRESFGVSQGEHSTASYCLTAGQFGQTQIRTNQQMGQELNQRDDRASLRCPTRLFRTLG